MTLINDPDLTELVSCADTEDLSIIADFITDKGDGRIALLSDVCDKLHSSSQARDFPMEVRALIVEEIQRFGGNSLVNIFRGGSGVCYREIVCDVADHVKVTYNSKSDCSQIEMAILYKVLEQSMDKISEEQKKQLFEEFGANYVGAGPATIAGLIAGIKLTGFGAYQVSALVANATARAFLGRGLAMGASGALMRGVSILTGPIGWAITAAWTVFDLASPAYRVTVPCVIQMAYMRQKALVRQCPDCGVSMPSDAKFCSQCGYKVETPALTYTSNKIEHLQ